MLCFEPGEDFFGAVVHAAGDAGELGDVDAVALVGGAGDDLMEEDDLVLPFFDGDVVVGDAGELVGQVGELVVVGGEEGAAADVLVEVFDDGPGEREAVVGAGAAADLVEDDEAARGGGVEDAGGLGHLDHERALAAGELVAGADAGEDAIGDADGGAAGRDEAAHLGHERQQRDLADVGAFAGHVGAGDEEEGGGGPGAAELGELGAQSPSSLSP